MTDVSTMIDLGPAPGPASIATPAPSAPAPSAPPAAPAAVRQFLTAGGGGLSVSDRGTDQPLGNEVVEDFAARGLATSPFGTAPGDVADLAAAARDSAPVNCPEGPYEDDDHGVLVAGPDDPDWDNLPVEYDGDEEDDHDEPPADSPPRDGGAPAPADAEDVAPGPLDLPEGQAEAPLLHSDAEGGLYPSVELEGQLARVLHATGLALLRCPDARPEGVVYDAIYGMRWEPDGLLELGVATLCQYGAALSAHQAWVSGLENEWRARYQNTKREYERALRLGGEATGGKTKQDREEEALRANPDLARVRNQYVLASALHTLLDGIGQRFVQLEDGLKRVIGLAQMEYQRGGGYAPTPAYG